MQTLADKTVSFYKTLSLTAKLPEGVQVMNPFQETSTLNVVEKFYKKFYNDNSNRYLILGINPGRLGGGTTGIPFTDPKQLMEVCGIHHSFVQKTELSSDFIYRMIDAYGGARNFYDRFFISAVCPLGFTQNGKNLNYYDSKPLQKSVYDFIVDSLQKQLAIGFNQEICFCLGEGQNFKFLQSLNQQHQFFKKIIPLAHPRFIMQYRRKRLNEYIQLYIDHFKQTDR